MAEGRVRLKHAIRGMLRLVLGSILYFLPPDVTFFALSTSQIKNCVCCARRHPVFPAA